MRVHRSRRRATTPLRLFNLALFAVAATLAMVTYSHADWPRWAASFVVPALWALIAALRPRVFISVQVLGWLWVSVAGTLAFLVLRWPAAPRFWSPLVWSHDAPAQAAVALLFGLGVLMIVLVTAYRTR
jgi:hypothetical protein